MRFLTLFFVFAAIQIKAQSEAVVFRSVDELLTYADSVAIPLKQQELMVDLAHLTKKASWGSAFNPRVPVSASLTNNTQLPVNFIPSEIFGGPTGTFREVQFGQQFVSMLNISPQVDIINPGKIGEMKSAALNEDLSKVEMNLFRQNFHIQLSYLYFNVLALQEQLAVIHENETIAEEIYFIVNQKVAQGLLSNVELNDSAIQLEELSTSKEILELNISTQQEMLRELLGIPAEVRVEGLLQSNEMLVNQMASANELFLKKYLLSKTFAQQNLSAARLQNLPTLSFFSSFNWQNNSNSTLLDSEQSWINSNYFGLRLTYDLPTNVSKLTQIGTLKITKEQQDLQYNLAKIQAETEKSKMNNDYVKALKDAKSDEKLAVLNEENYKIQKDRFDQELLPLDKILEAQRKLIVAKGEYASSLATLLYQSERIRINNTTR